jgi:large subunit ribosomal protein L13
MIIIDAENLIMGRMASQVAKMLLTGQEVAVVNAEKAVISGSKKQILQDYYHKRELGGPRKGPHYPRMPDRILKRTIRGMIPIKKTSGKEAFSKLKVYIGIPREFEGETLNTLRGASAEGKVKYIVLGDVSKQLGAKF